MMETPDSTHFESTPSATPDRPAGGPPKLAWPRDPRTEQTVQAVVVGSVLLAFAGIALLLTIGFILQLWLPAWAVALAFSVALTAAALAVFSSVRSLSSVMPAPPIAAESMPRESDEVDLAAIEELDADDLEPQTQRAPNSEPPSDSHRTSSVARSTRASAPFHPAAQAG